VVPRDSLIDAAYKRTAQLKVRPPHALGVTDELLEKETNVDLASALAMKARARLIRLSLPAAVMANFQLNFAVEVTRSNNYKIRGLFMGSNTSI